MSTVLSRLSILLHADTAQFRRDLNDTSTRLGRFGTNAKKAMKTAAVGIAAGAGIAVTAIGSIAKEQMAAAEEIEKFARLSNTSVVDFQRLAAGAADYGIEAENLASIYKDMNDRVGDFVQTGGGPMADFFENIGPKVGVTAEHFKNLSGPDALQLFYTSLEKANLSQADMTFYMESMAGDLTELQPLLANGGAGFKEMGDAAQNAGAIMSQDTIDATMKLNGDLASLETAFKGVKVQIFEAVLPAMMQAAEWFGKNQDEIKAFINGMVTAVEVMVPIVKGAFNGIKAAGEFLGVSIAKLVIGFQTAKDKIVNTATAIKNGFINLPSAMAQIGRDIIDGLINGIKEKAQAAVNTIKETAKGMYQGVKSFFNIHSPSRLMRELGVNVVEGLIVGVNDKKSDAYKAAVSVAQALLSGIESTRKEIALFGNDSAVAAFDYDVSVGKYDNVAPKLREEYRANLVKHENMMKEENARIAISAQIADRATQFQSDQDSAANAFNGLDINGPQTEAGKLKAAYEKKLAIIDEFESLHTDKTAQAEAARTKLREQHNADMERLDETRVGSQLASTTSLFKDLLGESSSGYKALFAVQKAYNFVEAQSASFAAIAKAWSSAPFPANLGAVAATTLQTGIIPTAINALKPEGFKTGGYTGNYSTDTAVGPVHGQEFVAHASATKKYRSELEAMNDGTYSKESGNNVNVNVTVNSDGTSSTESDSKTGRDMGNAISAVVRQQLIKEKRQGGLLYG